LARGGWGKGGERKTWKTGPEGRPEGLPTSKAATAGAPSGGGKKKQTWPRARFSVVSPGPAGKKKKKKTKKKPDPPVV